MRRNIKKFCFFISGLLFLAPPSEALRFSEFQPNAVGFKMGLYFPFGILGEIFYPGNFLGVNAEKKFSSHFSVEGQVGMGDFKGREKEDLRLLLLPLTIDGKYNLSKIRNRTVLNIKAGGGIYLTQIRLEDGAEKSWNFIGKSGIGLNCPFAERFAFQLEGEVTSLLEKEIIWVGSLKFGFVHRLGRR